MCITVVYSSSNEYEDSQQGTRSGVVAISSSLSSNFSTSGSSRNTEHKGGEADSLELSLCNKL